MRFLEDSSLIVRGRKTYSVRAFSLIEMLVTIGIIAVLAVLLMPTLKRSIMRTQAAGSQQNLRQLYSLFQLYAADNRYELPISSYRDGSMLLAWDKSLADYAETTKSFEKILRSPADRLARIASKNPRTYSMVRAGGFGAYSEYQRNIKTRFTSVDDPVKTLLLVERVHPSNVPYSDSCGVTDTPNQQLEYGQNLYDGRFVYLFVDGHIEFLRPEGTVGSGSLATPRGAWTLNSAD